MNQAYYTKIDDYVTGRLNAVEVVDFEREMSIDPELRKEVKLSMVLRDALTEEDVVSLREKLCQAKNNVEKNKFRISYKWFAAAGFFLLFGVSFLLWHSRSHNSLEIFDEYYQRFDAPAISRGGDQAEEYAEILSKYRNGEAEKVLPSLEKIYNQNKDDQIIELMIVSIYLELGEVQKVDEIINSRIETGDAGLLKDTYQWYLCLSYVKANKNQKAIDLCRIIEKSESKYAQQAIGLMSSLTKINIEK